MALLTALAGAPAYAQTVTPPPVPQLPDEPLPVWHPPLHHVQALHLDVGPEAARAHSIRQAGLWLASIGGASLLGFGLLYAWAADTAYNAGHLHNVEYHGMNVPTNVFDPALEDQTHRIADASYAFLGIGSVSLVAGVTLFTIGQLKLKQYHNEHPKDPLPPLSGY